MRQHDPSDTDKASVRIRHYIYGLLREFPDRSVRVPSSYELAEMFSTTRRVAQYELERLASNRILITRPRVGTFTNPACTYCTQIRFNGKVPLIGVIYGPGDYFTYSGKAAMLLSGIYRELALHHCNLYELRPVSRNEGAVFAEVKALHLDGVIWCGDLRFSDKSSLEKLPEGVNLVSCLHRGPEGCSRVHASRIHAAEELIRKLRERKIRKLLLAGLNLSSEEELTDLLLNAGFELEHCAPPSAGTLFDGIFAKALRMEDSTSAFLAWDGIASELQKRLAGAGKFPFAVAMYDTYDPDFQGGIWYSDYDAAAKESVRLVLAGIEGKAPSAVSIDVKIRFQNMEAIEQ